MYIYVNILTYIHIYTYIRIDVCIHTCTRMSVCVFVYICLSIYLSMHTDTRTQTPPPPVKVRKSRLQIMKDEEQVKKEGERRNQGGGIMQQCGRGRCNGQDRRDMGKDKIYFILFLSCHSRRKILNLCIMHFVALKMRCLR